MKVVNNPSTTPIHNESNKTCAASFFFPDPYALAIKAVVPVETAIIKD